MVYCASKERFASSSLDCLELQLLDEELVRCVRSFTGSFLQPRRSRRHLSIRRRPLLCQRWLLCRSHALSAVAGYSRRKTFYAGLARRYDLFSRIGVTPWRRTVRLRISDDEKYHQSCHPLSARKRRPVKDKMLVLRSLVLILVALI